MEEVVIRPLGEAQERAFYEKDPIVQRMQYEIRAAYEEAWRAAGGDPVQSPHTQEPKGWRLAWMGSRARKFLINNGIIQEGLGWK